MSTEIESGGVSRLESENKFSQMRLRLIHLTILAVVAALIQIGLHVIYRPWWCGDSPGYAGPAAVLYQMDFMRYTGERTPGYPLFLLGCELLTHDRVMGRLSPWQGEVVTWVQSALQVTSVVLIYLTAERLLIRRWINFGFALLFAFLVGVAQFAMLILSETLCLFVLVLAGYLTTIVFDRWGRGRSVQTFALLAGFTYGAAILVRTNVLFMWLAMVAVIPAWICWRILLRQKATCGSAVGTVARPIFSGGALLLVVWVFVNYQNTGLVSLTEISDLVRTCTAYNLFDQVHPKDKVLGEIMTKYYRQTNVNGKVDRVYIWLAMEELSRRSDEMPLNIKPGQRWLRTDALFRYVGNVSTGLLWEHPQAWAKNSLSDWTRTFDFSFFQPLPDEMVDPVALTHKPVIANIHGAKIVSGIVDVESSLCVLLYLLTFVSAVVALVSASAGSEFEAALVPLTVLAFSAGALVCMTAPSILACYDSRYSVPLLPSFALCSAYVFEQGLSFIQRRKT